MSNSQYSEDQRITTGKAVAISTLINTLNSCSRNDTTGSVKICRRPQQTNSITQDVIAKRKQIGYHELAATPTLDMSKHLVLDKSKLKTQRRNFSEILVTTRE
jgi:hypothetical protein